MFCVTTMDDDAAHVLELHDLKITEEKAEGVADEIEIFSWLIFIFSLVCLKHEATGCCAFNFNSKKRRTEKRAIMHGCDINL